MKRSDDFRQAENIFSKQASSAEVGIKEDTSSDDSPSPSAAATRSATEGQFIDIMMIISNYTISLIKEQYMLRTGTAKGLTIGEFVAVMETCLKNHIVDRITFVIQAIELFKQVDLNGDGVMEWHEFTR
jgi:hypothetical protein